MNVLFWNSIWLLYINGNKWNFHKIVLLLLTSNLVWLLFYAITNTQMELQVFPIFSRYKIWLRRLGLKVHVHVHVFNDISSIQLVLHWIMNIVVIQWNLWTKGPAILSIVERLSALESSWKCILYLYLNTFQSIVFVSEICLKMKYLYFVFVIDTIYMYEVTIIIMRKCTFGTLECFLYREVILLCLLRGSFIGKIYCITLLIFI